jgi:hypothetical protein
VIGSGQERVRQYQEALACVWPRFLWSSVHGDYAGEDETQVRMLRNLFVFIFHTVPTVVVIWLM